MTGCVRSRAILSSKLKIRKNVIKDEIDHNGAYLCVCECQKKLNLSYLVYFIWNSGQKVRSNFSEKWRLFCFVLFCQLRLGNSNYKKKIARNVARRKSLANRLVKHGNDGEDDVNGRAKNDGKEPKTTVISTAKVARRSNG